MRSDQVSPHKSESRPKPQNVAFVFLDFGEGGAQRAALLSFRHLDRRRFQAHLVCARGDGALVARAARLGIGVYRLNRMRHRADLGVVFALTRCFRQIDAHIVHVPLYSRVSPYARVAARLAGVKLTVAHEHCRPVAPSRLRRLTDRALVQGTRFIAVSAIDRSNLMQVGVRDAQIEMVPNGVDLDRFTPSDRDVARGTLGLDRSASIALVPARLHPQKRHVDLIDALARIRSKSAAQGQSGDANPELKVYCLGDGPLRHQLPALAESAGLHQQLHFLGHREDVETWLAAADLVVLPSWVEGHPLALLEAQAAGRPVLATAVGGVPEIVAEGETGRLVPARDPSALADALLDMLADSRAREDMGRAARQRAVQHFGADRSARRLEACYTRWMAERGALQLGWDVEPAESTADEQDRAATTPEQRS